MTTELDQATEKTVVRSLIGRRFPKNFCLPNYAPPGWWENDLYLITPADYWWEFEVKLTLADFRRDKEKRQEVGPYEFGKDRPSETKHDLLSKTDRGPARFWYVAPLGVIPVALVPPWAGLIELTTIGRAHYERIIVDAPVRHKNKVEDLVRRQALETCYWRMHRLL